MALFVAITAITRRYVHLYPSSSLPKRWRHPPHLRGEPIALEVGVRKGEDEAVVGLSELQELRARRLDGLHRVVPRAAVLRQGHQLGDHRQAALLIHRRLPEGHQLLGKAMKWLGLAKG